MTRQPSLPRGPAAEPWLPRRDTTILLWSASLELQGAVGRVSAAAAVELIVGTELEQAAGRWDDVAALLVDADVLADAAGETGLAGWRGPIAVVGFARDSARMWHQAERLGADRVAILPDCAPWLANYLGCLRNPASGGGVVGFVGGCGGAGASTAAVLVAAGAVRQGVRTLLVDGDPWGGGLGSAVSVHNVPGLRWPELLLASGAINPEQLAAALPQPAGLALLSWDAAHQRDGTAPPSDAAASALSLAESGAAVGEVMRAARGAYGLVVVDVGRTPHAVKTLAPHCNGVVVVVPAQQRAAAAARQMLETLPPQRAAAVVRGPVGEGVDAAMVAAAIGLPLVGRLPRVRQIEEMLESGRLPELQRRRPVQTLVANVLGWMAGEGPDGATAGGARTPRRMSP